MIESLVWGKYLVCISPGIIPHHVLRILEGIRYSLLPLQACMCAYCRTGFPFAFGVFESYYVTDILFSDDTS
jgi:hypothetical protein